jgi:hypothetical protein
VELPNTSGKKQKYPAFLALVDDNGIRKAMTGKKLICKGTCGMKEEKIAFEPTTGTVPVQAVEDQPAAFIGESGLDPDRHGGCRRGRGSRGNRPGPPAPQAQTPGAPPPQPQAPAAPPAQPPGAPPVTAASLTGPWTKLVKDVQAYAAAHPERKADLFKDMAAIGALLKANQAAEAKTKMDKMQAALDAACAPSAAGCRGPAGAAPRRSTVNGRLADWRLDQAGEGRAGLRRRAPRAQSRPVPRHGRHWRAAQGQSSRGSQTENGQDAGNARRASGGGGQARGSPAGEAKPAAEKAKEKQRKRKAKRARTRKRKKRRRSSGRM